MSAEEITLGEIVSQFGLELIGDADYAIEGVAPLQSGEPHKISFLANPKFSDYLNSTQAGAVIVEPAFASASHLNLLVHDNPYACFAKIASLYQRSSGSPAGVHATAVVDSAATVDPESSLGAHVVIGAGSKIAAGATLHPGVVVGRDCEVGEGTVLHANVTLYDDVHLGARVTIHSGAVIGADGFGIAWEDGGWIKVPQLGGVRIGDDCEIGANTSIDRGALEHTVLEQDVQLDNQVHIAHNVHIGAHTAMAGCAAAAGSARIGSNCMIAGGAGVLGHLEVADGVTITAMSLVTHSLRQPGTYSSGTALDENRKWRKSAARFKHLDKIARELRYLKKKMESV